MFNWLTLWVRALCESSWFQFWLSHHLLFTHPFRSEFTEISHKKRFKSSFFSWIYFNWRVKSFSLFQCHSPVMLFARALLPLFKQTPPEQYFVARTVASVADMCFLSPISGKCHYNIFLIKKKLPPFFQAIASLCSHELWADFFYTSLFQHHPRYSIWFSTENCKTHTNVKIQTLLQA